MSLTHLSLLLLLTFLLSTATTVLTSTQPDGFLSLYCGASAPFTDSSNISWAPDAPYISVGNSTATSSRTPLRVFPANSEPGTRFCYRLPVPDSSPVLVRSRFVYGNYDGLDRPPYFAVSLGRATVGVVNLTSSDPSVEEFVWRVDRKDTTLQFCLLPVRNGGSPVMSSLEVRPLPEGAYGSGAGTSLLRKRFRINCGYVDSNPIRYPFDYYDRVWDADRNFWPSRLSAGFRIPFPFDLSGILESPPVSVLETARVLVRKDVMTYNFSLDKLGDYHVVLYFAGIMPVTSSFDVIINGDMVSSGYEVKHGETGSIFFLGKGIDRVTITFRNSSFYPQVNAIEIYEVIEIPMECSSTTVSALKVIQQSSGFDLGWDDDPCHPTPWKHVGCHRNLVTSLEIQNIELREIVPTFGDLIDLRKLDLHNTSLAGRVVNLGSLQQLETLNLSFNKLTSFGSDFDTMVSLRILDLKHNSLEGTVPKTLGSLKDLRFLNLDNNKLRGPLPQSLNKESLEIRTSGNLCLSFSLSTCNGVADHPSIATPHVTVLNLKKHSGHNHRTIIAAAVGAFSCALLILAIIIFIYLRNKKGGDDKASNTWTARDMQGWHSSKVFTYKEIKIATNNFKDAIGGGGFGNVYLGKLTDGKLVAVKVRSDKTQLGADSFINEVHLLSQVRHQNLVLLEGFCCESKQQILVYEYIPGGSLADNLYGSNSKKATLNWSRRLKIAVDAAKGLEYLHNGNNPRIIHRDVKCSNILLDLDMNAKVGDFGLSKQLPQADATHVTTAVKGTTGYLDPEYFVTQQLTEKSDVYSFGVVLLELICGREPLSHVGMPDSFNLVLWAKPYLQADAFEIVDENLKGGFGVESMKKAASIAVRCVERDATERPDIAEVLAELKEAYSIQLTTLSSAGHLY